MNVPAPEGFLVVKNSPLRWIGFAAISLLFVVMGVAFVASPETFEGKRSAAFVAVIGWVSMVGFGACLVVSIRQVFDRRPRLVIDRDGIEDRQMRVGKIPWDQIQDASMVRMRGVYLISLFLQDPTPWLAKLPRIRRAGMRMNQRMGLSPFVVSLAGASSNPNDVNALILAHIARVHARDQTAPTRLT